MKKITSSQNWDLFQDDILRIQALLRLKDYDATLAESQSIWENHSGEWMAGWLWLPDTDEELWDTIRPYVEINT